MTTIGSIWLLATIGLPLCGAAALSSVRDADRSRRWCLAIATAVLAVATVAWAEFSWWKGAAADAAPLALDQLSAPLAPLAALLYLLTAVATLRTKVRRFSFLWMLVSEAIVLATLACRMPWGIVALLAVGTIPPYFELRARRKPTQVYVVHMAVFVALLVAGWQLLASQAGGGLAPAWAATPLVLALFIRCGIAPLHSPARTPRYNGACEAGIRHLKLQTRHVAALEGGDPDRAWTSGDLERALAQAQDFHEARNGGVPGCIVSPELRQRFAQRLAQETDIAREELGLPSDRPPGIMDALRLARIATRRTLVALGILSFKRRWMTLPFRSIFSAKIS